MVRNFAKIRLCLLLLSASTSGFADDIRSPECQMIMEALDSNQPTKNLLLLRKRKINLNQPCAYVWGDSFEDRPSLVYAARFYELSIVTALIEAGANVNVADTEGNTPLMWARDFATAQLLLQSKAKVNIQDQRGWTPLMHQLTAFPESSPQTIEALIKAGAKVNHRDNEGRTALMVAANKDFVRILIEAKADVNAVDNEGNSALMAAVQTGNIETIELLVAAKANLFLKNRSGTSALDLAIRSGNRDIAALIQTARQKNSPQKESTHPILRIQTQNGSILIGKLVRENDLELVILQNGNRFLIKKSDIRLREFADE